MAVERLESKPLRAVAAHFQRSINLTYDAGNADYIAGYIPTPNGAKALATILANAAPAKTQRAHVLHAAYGSGKSLLGLVLSALCQPDAASEVSKASKASKASDEMGETGETITGALQRVSARLGAGFAAEARSIQAFRAQKRRLLPVLLSGNEGPLSLAFYEVGSHNLWALAGLHAALSWLQETGREAIIKYTQQLACRLREGLADLADLELQTPPKDVLWGGILSFSLAGVTPQTLEAVLGARGVAVRAGLHCAPWTHQWLGALVRGTVRVSPAYANEVTDSDLFLAISKEIAG